jgi:hypothetical protein
MIRTSQRIPYKVSRNIVVLNYKIILLDFLLSAGIWELRPFGGRELYPTVCAVLTAYPSKSIPADQLRLQYLPS